MMDTLKRKKPEFITIPLNLSKYGIRKVRIPKYFEEELLERENLDRKKNLLRECHVKSEKRKLLVKVLTESLKWSGKAKDGNSKRTRRTRGKGSKSGSSSMGCHTEIGVINTFPTVDAEAACTTVSKESTAEIYIEPEYEPETNSQVGACILQPSASPPMSSSLQQLGRMMIVGHVNVQYSLVRGDAGFSRLYVNEVFTPLPGAPCDITGIPARIENVNDITEVVAQNWASFEPSIAESNDEHGNDRHGVTSEPSITVGNEEDENGCSHHVAPSDACSEFSIVESYDEHGNDVHGVTSEPSTSEGNDEEENSQVHHVAPTGAGSEPSVVEGDDEHGNDDKASEPSTSEGNDEDKNSQVHQVAPTGADSEFSIVESYDEHGNDIHGVTSEPSTSEGNDEEEKSQVHHVAPTCAGSEPSVVEGDDEHGNDDKASEPSSSEGNDEDENSQVHQVAPTGADSEPSVVEGNDEHGNDGIASETSTTEGYDEDENSQVHQVAPTGLDSEPSVVEGDDEHGNERIASEPTTTVGSDGDENSPRKVAISGSKPSITEGKDEYHSSYRGGHFNTAANPFSGYSSGYWNNLGRVASPSPIRPAGYTRFHHPISLPAAAPTVYQCRRTYRRPLNLVSPGVSPAGRRYYGPDAPIRPTKRIKFRR